MIDAISQAIQSQALHTAEVMAYATIAIATFEHYTGVGPKQLPGKWQLVPALVLTIGGLLAFALDAGMPWWLSCVVAVVNGTLAGAGSNATHVVAQAVGGKKRREGKGPDTLRSSAGLIVLGLLLSGCGIVKSASDEVASICEGYLAAQPDVQEQAQRKGVSPLVIAEAICMANDAGRAIWELFQVQQPEPGVMMSVQPDEQLERAKDHALTVARKRGLIQ
jgi:hypothetical protein